MGKHMTLDQRIAIQVGLERDDSVKSIARQIGKSPRSVAREIKQRRLSCGEPRYGRVNNRCEHRASCPDWARCPGLKGCARYAEERCPRTLGAPFVCNGCARQNKCVLARFLYNAKKADKAYRDMLSGSRRGANIAEAELAWLDGLVSPGVFKGQSIHHAVLEQRMRLPVSERTIYRYFKNGGMFTALRGDLRRACRLKPRKGKKKEHKLDTKCRENRTFEHYTAFVSEHTLASIGQMDLVIGRVGGKCLLTLHFVRQCFQIALLIRDKTAQSVIDALKGLRARIGPHTFRKLFEVILTDNGTEFSDPTKIEHDEADRALCRVFCCDSYVTNQKAQCDRNHEYIRMVPPTGTNLDALTQEQVDLVMSHVNSYARPKLGDARPVDEFDKLFGERVRIALGVRKIEADRILLKPSLLKWP